MWITALLVIEAKNDVRLFVHHGFDQRLSEAFVVYLLLKRSPFSMEGDHFLTTEIYLFIYFNQ